METKLKACVVGGGAGGKLSMNALKASERFQLVAAADQRPEVGEVLQKDFPGIRTFTDHRRMFEACPVDVVCVSTWAPSHEEITRDALALPLKGILVEKPLGHTWASGKRILDMVRAKGLPMAVPHGLLARPHSREILARVHAGEIGALKLVEIECAKWDLINAGIHWLNFFVALTKNEPLDSVMAQCDKSTRTFRDGMQVETVAVTYAQTRSGVRVVMQTGDDVATNRAGKDALFRLVGTEGMIEFWGWENEYRVVNAQHPKGETFAPKVSDAVGHQWHLGHLASMVQSGKVDYGIPESSLMALELCEGAYASSRNRCRVKLPLSSFVPPPPNDWAPGEPYSGFGGGRDGRKL